MAGATLKSLQNEAMRRSSTEMQKKDFTLSDFISEEKLTELHIENFKAAGKQKKFDEVDAMCAEIVARFGLEVYEKWNSGEIPDKKITAWLYAERAREASLLVHLEATMINGISATVKVGEGERKPKGIDRANKLIKAMNKIIRGEN